MGGLLLPPATFRQRKAVMIKLEPNVQTFGMRTELLLAIVIAERIWSGYGVDLVLTSMCDGKHSETSLHNAGAAVDMRSRDLASDAKVEAVKQLKAALGRDYDVILEVDHVHVEFQPRYRKSEG